MIASAVKRYKVFVAASFVPILFCIIGLMLTACSPQDIKYDEAIAIAKNDFGCEKVLWIKSNALILESKPDDEPKVNNMRSHYEYYIVGEKDGREIYIVVPSTPNLDKPYITTWGLDYSFAQIVAKFNELGAQYVADVPDDYYGASLDSYIYLEIVTDKNCDSFVDNYNIGVDGSTFYERLDIKVVFEYVWERGGYKHYCIVTQENGELNAYEHVRAVS